MKINAGPFEVKYNKPEKTHSYDQDSRFRTVPKSSTETEAITAGHIVVVGQSLIKTYFIWKMTDRLVARVLR